MPSKSNKTQTHAGFKFLDFLSGELLNEREHARSKTCKMVNASSEDSEDCILSAETLIYSRRILTGT